MSLVIIVISATLGLFLIAVITAIDIENYVFTDYLFWNNPDNLYYSTKLNYVSCWIYCIIVYIFSLMSIYKLAYYLTHIGRK